MMLLWSPHPLPPLSLYCDVTLCMLRDSDIVHRLLDMIGGVLSDPRRDETHVDNLSLIDNLRCKLEGFQRQERNIAEGVWNRVVIALNSRGRVEDSCPLASQLITRCGAYETSLDVSSQLCVCIATTVFGILWESCDDDTGLCSLNADPRGRDSFEDFISKHVYRFTPLSKSLQASGITQVECKTHIDEDVARRLRATLEKCGRVIVSAMYSRLHGSIGTWPTILDKTFTQTLPRYLPVSFCLSCNVTEV